MGLSWHNLLAVGLGGMLGAIGRFYINITIGRLFPLDIPLATLSVNLIGSFFIGLLSALFLYFTPSDSLRLFLITGFLGALTTYSAFAIETYFLLGNSPAYGLLNILLNLVGSITCVACGYKLVLYFLR